VKLRKQPGAKLAVVASTLALLGAFFALVRSNPRISAEASVEPAAPSASYRDFFFPTGTPVPRTAAPVAPQRPHTRTKAS
jgi:hypothetical protein